MQDWKALYESGKGGGRYSAAVMDHFMNPRNVGHIEDPDGIGAYGDPSCGDYLVVNVRLDGEVIADIRFLVHGCPGSVSTSSAMTCLVKGRTVQEGLGLTDEDVIDYLGGIPEDKKHCSLLGVHALRAALADAIFMRTLIEQGLVKDREEYRRIQSENRCDAGPGHACDGSCGKEEDELRRETDD